MKTLEKEIFRYLEDHKEDMIEDILELVRAESPSSDKQAVDRCGEVLCSIYQRRLGVMPEVHEREKAGNVLCTEIGQGDKALLLLGHFDTVHKIGSVPVHRDDTCLYGPGVIDMKGGDIAIIWAMKALKELGIPTDKKVIVINNGDEEIGSGQSKGLILEKARECAACIVAEPADPEGKIKISRKGLARVHIRCRGKAAHSGNNPQAGINANIELAHQIIFIEGLSDYDRGTTFSVNLISGGKVSNAVSDYADAVVDWRMCEDSELDRCAELFKEPKNYLEGAQVEYEIELGRPPYDMNEANLNLYHLAQEVAADFDMKIEAGERSGGGSDGNFTSNAGIPTIDGMGMVGNYQHNPKECLYLDELVPRVALLAGLIHRV